MGSTCLPRGRGSAAVLAFIAFALSAGPLASAPRKVRIGIFPAAPLVFEKDGKPAGLFIELAEHFARELGWNLEFERGTWENLQAELTDGRIDLLPALGYTPERTKTRDFSKHPVFVDSGVVFTSPRFPIHTVFDLEGRKIAAVRGSVFTEGFLIYTGSFGISCRMVLTEDNAQVMAAIADGSADAGVTIYSLGTELARSYPVRVTPISFSPVALHFAVRKDVNADILEGIDRLMAAMVDDPESFYSRAFRKWTQPEPERTVPAWIWFTLAGIAAAGMLFAAWSLSLRSQVAAKTKSLTAEIQERIRAEEHLKATLLQEETLLRELAHRIGNSLQLVKSLVGLKAADYPDKSVEAFARNLGGKLDSIILAQRMLPESDDLSSIPLRRYIENLTETILSELGRSDGSIRVRIEVDAPDILLDIAIPLGLIVNELVSNSLLHGIPEGREGTIRIEACETAPGRLCVRYADDGSGVPPGFDPRTQDGSGFRFILALAEGQLKGAVTFPAGNGFRCSFEVPTDLYHRRITLRSDYSE